MVTGQVMPPNEQGGWLVRLDVSAKAEAEGQHYFVPFCMRDEQRSS